MRSLSLEQPLGLPRSLTLFQVIQKIGLCVSFYDLLESSDGLIGHGTGLVNVNGKLRLKSPPLRTWLILDQ
jgi:hypothetical protein